MQKGSLIFDGRGGGCINGWLSHIPKRFVFIAAPTGWVWVTFKFGILVSVVNVFMAFL